jgi:chemotaxis protein methyltransferase CheR
MTRIVVSDSTTSDSVMSDIQTFLGVEDASILALAIVDSVSEPLVVLDSDLRVVAASASFYRTFNLDRQSAQGRRIYELDKDQWDIAELRMLLEKVLPEHGAVDGYEVEREFPAIGRRALRMSARRVRHRGNLRSNILLTLADVTQRRVMEREMQELMWQQETLLKEMRRRVGNSCALMASILMLQSKTAQSEEARRELDDVHKRVVLVAAAQDNLHVAGQTELIEIAPYLSRLCQALADAMIGEGAAVSLQVEAAAGHMTSAQAGSLGLIVAELVLEALNRALPGQIVVTFEVAGTGWKLSVRDCGTGHETNLTQANLARADAAPHAQEGPSLGASIVRTLAQQLEAEVEIKTGSAGTTVSIAHATAHLAAAGRSRQDRAVPLPKRALGVPGKSSTGRGKFAA